MIKHTQNAIFSGRRADTDSASGLTCPNYEKLVQAFGFEYLRLEKEEETKSVINMFLDCQNPIILEVFMNPQQLLVPKLSANTSSEGTLVSPTLEDLSPLIGLDLLQTLLLAPIHPNSSKLDRRSKDAEGDASTNTNYNIYAHK